jgi:hypothetical protein
MYYILLLATLSGLGFLYRKNIKKSYNDFRDLNQAVSRFHKNPCKILYISTEMVCKKWWFQVLHWINNSIEKHIDKNVSILTYVLDGKLYKIVLDHRKGPPLVLLVTDEKEEDVTSLVVPFLGPKRDWHKREFTPAFWGKEQLSFELATGTNKTFKKEEVITLNSST